MELSVEFLVSDAGLSNDTWNYIVGTSPRLYETLFPAWFGFYCLGI